MANSMKAVLKSASQPVALEVALEEARMANGSATSSAPPADPEVVAIARRRQFSPAEKRRIVAAADRCTQPGAVGALLRREGIYSSQLAAWRKNRAAADGGGRAERKRGRQADPALAEAQRSAKLTRENERLRRQLAQARLIIDVQKKVSSLIALQGADEADGESAWTV
jgi:transposase-like protein